MSARLRRNCDGACLVSGDDFICRQVQLARVGSQKGAGEEITGELIEIAALEGLQKRDFDLGARRNLLERQAGALAFGP